MFVKLYATSSGQMVWVNPNHIEQFELMQDGKETALTTRSGDFIAVRETPEQLAILFATAAERS
jgi:uncharacterized protein YlzI (FlbEa/FlbD family)